MATFIKDSVRVYIARENVTSKTWSGGISSLGVLGAAALSQNTSSREIMEVENVTGVSIGSFNLEFDTFQTLKDAFDHDIEIKEVGSGSCDFIAKNGTNTTGNDLSHDELWALAYELPNGWNSAPGTVPIWDPAADVEATGGAPKTAATDDRGYAIIVEQKIATSSYLFWCFFNCKIACSINFASKQASRGTLSWDDARFISFDKHTAAPVVGTSILAPAVAYGWSAP